LTEYAPGSGKGNNEPERGKCNIWVLSKSTKLRIMISSQAKSKQIKNFTLFLQKIIADLFKGNERQHLPGGKKINIQVCYMVKDLHKQAVGICKLLIVRPIPCNFRNQNEHLARESETAPESGRVLETHIYRSISQMLQVHCISTFTFVADSFMKELRHLRVISMVFPFQNERKMGLSVSFTSSPSDLIKIKTKQACILHILIHNTTIRLITFMK